MGFSRVIGQTLAKKSLGRLMGLQSSVVIEGPSGSGKGFLAKQFAEEITEREYVRVVKSGNRLTVGDARELVRWVQVKSFTGDPKVVIIEDADRVSELCLNVFLKAVEEGFGRWIFTTIDCKALLDTIVSRCFRVRTGQFTEDELYSVARTWKYLDSDSREGAHQAHGSLKYLYAYLEGELGDTETLATELVEACRRRKLGRLFRELSNFRGERSRLTAFSVLDYVLDFALQNQWSSEEVSKVILASQNLKSGGSPYLCMSNLFLSLKVV